MSDARIDAKAAGQMLGISARKVYELAAPDGPISCYRFGRALRFDPSDIEAYLVSKMPPEPPRMNARELRETERLRLLANGVGANLPCLLTPAELEFLALRFRRMRMAPWADAQAISTIYARAKRLSTETGIAHQVDHVIPLLGELVSGLHVETNLQILARSENVLKRNRFEIG